MNKANLIVIVASLLSLGCSRCSSTTGAEGFEKIEHFLLIQVQSDDVEANVEAASEWLRGDATHDRPDGALNQLLAVQKVTDDEAMCGESGFNIIKPNVEATRELTRTKAIVEHFLKLHADHCDDKYIKLTKERFEQHGFGFNIFPVNEVCRSIASELFHRDIDQFLLEAYERSTNILQLIDSVKFDESINVRSSIHSTLYNSPKTNSEAYRKSIDSYPRRRLMAGSDETSRYLKMYIFNKLRDYTELLGPGLFSPAEYDARILGRNFELPVGVSKWQAVNFYKGWLNYKILQVFVMPRAEELLKETRNYALDLKEGRWDNHFIP